jgi:hypothetical protein
MSTDATVAFMLDSPVESTANAPVGTAFVVACAFNA